MRRPLSMIHYQLSIVFCLLTGIQTMQAAQPKREMRAVWIATVANIDWPSRRWLSTAEQQDEMLRLLDGLARNHVNTVILQIRPTADALYLSPYEPWSHWLTGKQGERPEPYYDPLQFVIDEAHRRFMEVHVWLNPYRVTQAGGAGDLSEEHPFFQHRDLFVRYGNAWYFDPGLDETRAWLNRVVRDVVERYDIDAIHMDDYFYPYKIKGEDFPDQATFEAHPRGFAPDQKDDWRRNNVNLIIAELQRTIKTAKPWVEFGISPFGVWRNRSADPQGSDTQAGVQNYDDLYADILLWLREGNIDYVAPQLYWEIGKPAADYEVLARWWGDHAYGKNLYLGMAAYKMGDPAQPAPWHEGNELLRQLRLNRSLPQVDGSMYYNATAFLSNPAGLCDSLQASWYRYPALCPVNRNAKGRPATPPQRVRVLRDGDQALLMWDKAEGRGGEATAYYVVYAFRSKQVGDLNDPANILARTHDNYLDLTTVPGFDPSGYHTFVVTSVNRYRRESVPTHAVTRKM